MAEFIQVVTTVDSKSVAREIAEAVVEQKLAACVQISQCLSIYRWQGKIADATEFLCVMKSRSDLFSKLQEAIMKIHTYDVPEIIATDVVLGNSDYLAWLTDSLHEIGSQ